MLQGKTSYWPLCRILILNRILSFSTMAATMATTVRMGQVKGHNDKSNEVIVCQNWSTKPHSHVIFFGGDVQDYKENMESHRDNHRYAAWNLESTAELVQKKYPKSLVSVIKPSEMHLRTFSVYSNFVEFDALGVHYLGPEKGSWSHLKALHRNILAEVEKNRDEVSGQCQSDSTKEEKCVQDSLNSEHFSSLPIHIVGFSKGCVVLNQLLYDLSSSHKEPEAADFIRNVKTLTWLDGGHAGGFNTWVTDENILEELKKTGIKIFVHVTPYQVRDPMRQWIGKEEKKFVEKSRKLGIDIKEVLHFCDEKGSLENHFEVIRVFTNAL